MNDIIELNSNYSTTRRVIKAPAQDIAGLVKQSNKPEDKFDTVLFLPEVEGRQGEGGLRTKGYFKVGGIIPENTVIASEAKQSSQNSTLEQKPLITVVTVVFNGEKFLEETILSVISQTYDSVEYIIIDGGSTDSTLDIIKKYEYAIDYWVSENDKGIYDAMNKGIDLASGKWINFMNAGDLFFSNDVIRYIFNGLLVDKLVIFGKSITKYESLSYTRYSDFNLSDKNFFKYKMPNHQAVFLSHVFYKNTKYDLSYSVAADTDYLNKAFSLDSYKYIDQEISVFYLGGISSYYPNIKLLKRIYKDEVMLGGSRVKLLIKHFFKYLIMNILGEKLYFKFYFKFLETNGK